MSSSAANPYAPPATQDPATVETPYWTVSNGTVQFQNGAQLPPVDLAEEAEPAELFPVVRLRRGSAMGVLALLFGVVFGLASVQLVLPSFNRATFGPVILGVAVLAALVRRSANKHFRVKYYVSRRYLLRLNRLSALVRWIALLTVGAACLLLGLWTARSDATSPDRVVSLLLPLIVVLLTPQVILLRRLRPSVEHGSGPWARLGKVSHSALEKLAVLERERRHVPAPEPRTVRVYRAYVYRFPLRHLTVRGWLNPILLPFFLLRRRMSRHVPVEVFHDSEAISLPPDHTPADLRALAAPWLADLSPQGLTLQEIRRKEAPTGNYLVEVMHFTTADLSHVLLLTVTSQPYGGVRLLRYVSWAFHTLLSDGTTVRTGSRTLLTPVAGTEDHVAGGKRRQLWKKHLAAIGGRTVAPAATADEWMSRHLSWSEEVHAANRAAGYETEVEEKTLPA